MVLQKYIPKDTRPIHKKTLGFFGPILEAPHLENSNGNTEVDTDASVDIDVREVYYLIMHFLSAGPCQRTFGQLWNELLEHRLLPRRYHAWCSRSGAHSGDGNDDGLSYPLSYNNLTERYPHVEKDHLVKLLKKLLLSTSHRSQSIIDRGRPNAVDVPTLLGTGPFSLLNYDRAKEDKGIRSPPVYLRWPHVNADQMQGLCLREIGGGFTRHHRAPSIRAACYVIAKPSAMVQKMQSFKKVRGHRNAVYCAIFDRSGRYVITGSDDRLVKIWSMETACCLASCRGHEGDITDLAVSSNNTMVASSSNDFVIRVWHLADGYPLSVLRGHTGVVTAIVFSPRPSAVYQLLSSSDDGTCRIWDARYSHCAPRVYVPKPENTAGKSNGPLTSVGQQRHQVSCCAFNANGTIFVTGSSDTFARVWYASKPGLEESEHPKHELDVLAGHENDVNYVQFSCCGVPSKPCLFDASKEDNSRKFRSSWFTQDNIVTCSRDGSAIIWIPKSRRSHAKFGRWTKAYHLKVPPPPMPPQPQRGGPRQRILPTPRGVNMIVWSLDNRFVLAAIMDRRICVWNAITGNIVHSLTGHTESTYVLDVHPFNPRIAMSAGYDGKTIVWDIWEGKPVRIFEIGRFKLVDGKFSPDGMSIVLSDDVGQLYILSTGGGEPQRDAKYDQFFLGDYRPIIQDASGNVLDQETQLLAYVRNMQDLLCDSGMIPYPEPYQSIYQKQRLRSLGKPNEWRPLPVELAIGTDVSIGQDYSLFPLPDLDALLDSLPEFADPLDFGPEIEVQTDDTDSEYNVLDESSSGGEEGSLNTLTGESASSDENTDFEQCGIEKLRRSRRRKSKDDKFVSSLGRHIKRRNLDKENGDPFINTTKKLKKRRKPSGHKSSTLKTSKPQRAAARKARTLFTKISGTSTEEEYDSNAESSESQSSLISSNLESDASAGDGQCDNEEAFAPDIHEDVAKPAVYSVSQKNGNRKRLVLKLSIRDSSKHVNSKSNIIDPDHFDEAGGSSGRASEEFPEDLLDHFNSEIPCPSPPNLDLDIDQDIGRGDSDNPVSNSNLCERYGDGRMKWGGVKIRTSKRLKLEGVESGAYAGSGALINGHGEDDEAGGSLEPDCNLQMQDDVDKVDPICQGEVQPSASDSSKGRDGNCTKIPSWQIDPVDADASSPCKEDLTCCQNLKDKSPGTRLRIKSKGLQSYRNIPPSEDVCMDDWRKSECNGFSHSPVRTHQNSLPDLLEDARRSSVCEGAISRQDESHLNDNRYNAVYRRCRSSKAVTYAEGTNFGAEEGTSYGNHFHSDFAIHPYSRKTRGPRILCDPTTSTTKFVGGHCLPMASKQTDRFPAIDSSHLMQETRPATVMQLGHRSTRTRRPNSYFHDTSSPDKKKMHPTLRKLSWLMLSTHEEGSRYIPQKGDDVVYIRQGHEEYLNYICSSDVGPWRSIVGTIRAVEFCKVQMLEYSTVPGSGESCCKMLLKFTDYTSSVFNRTFKLTLPEVTGFPDFLVEKSRYDAAIERNWTSRDKCQVWWKNEGEEDGSWWHGRVMTINDKSAEFPYSPWERYIIQYKSDPRETHRHSPWELYDTDTRWEPPRIDADCRNKLLSCFSKLEKSAQKSQDHYGVQKLRQLAQKSNFLNRFPVPLSPEVVHSRVENNYYRGVDAVKHDVDVMLANAESYFEKNVEMSEKIGRLGNLFSRTLSSL